MGENEKGGQSMTDASKKKKQPFKAGLILKEGIFIKNPVLTAGLAVTPVVAGGFTLKAGVALSVLNAILLIVPCMVLFLLGKRISSSMRPLAAVLCAAVLYIPCAWLFDSVHPGLMNQLGVFLPLLIVDSLLLKRGCDISRGKKLSLVFLSAFSNAVGFGLVMCIMAAIREILTQSTLWGIHLPWGQHIPMAALPFAGLILLGFLAAFFRWLRGEKHHYWDSPLKPSERSLKP